MPPRTARPTGRRYWFSRDGEPWEEGTTRSWADAITRISLSGETLVVDMSDAEVPDRKLRRAAIKRAHATVVRSSKRRGLRLVRHHEGRYLRFRIVEQETP
jgi:hypothetical protein